VSVTIEAGELQHVDLSGHRDEKRLGRRVSPVPEQRIVYKRTIFELEGESPEITSVTSFRNTLAPAWHHVVATWDGST
jgi:hypothetical protein